MTKFQRLPLIKLCARKQRIKRFLRQCGFSMLNNPEIFKDSAIMEIGDLITAGAVGKVRV